jgi:hypothetical protein
MSRKALAHITVSVALGDPVNSQGILTVLRDWKEKHKLQRKMQTGE